MIFEKKMINSHVTEIIYRSNEWNSIMFYHNLFNAEIDIIQIVHCRDDVYLIEYMNLDEIDEMMDDTQQKSVCAIQMDHVQKKDWKLLDINQPIKVLGKRDKPKIPTTPKGVVMGYPDVPIEGNIEGGGGVL